MRRGNGRLLQQICGSDTDDTTSAKGRYRRKTSDSYETPVTKLGHEHGEGGFVRADQLQARDLND
jgi:hypothetical protein